MFQLTLDSIEYQTLQACKVGRQLIRNRIMNAVVTQISDKNIISENKYELN